MTDERESILEKLMVLPPSPFKRFWLTYSVSVAALLLTMALAEGRLGWSPPDGWLRYATALAPVVPSAVIVWFLAISWMGETDEFVRTLWSRIAAVGMAVTLITGTAWLALNRYADVAPMHPLALVLVLAWVLPFLATVVWWKHR